jgi:hypothetical protein
MQGVEICHVEHCAGTNDRVLDLSQLKPWLIDRHACVLGLGQNRVALRTGPQKRIDQNQHLPGCFPAFIRFGMATSAAACGFFPQSKQFVVRKLDSVITMARSAPRSLRFHEHAIMGTQREIFPDLEVAFGADAAH